MAWCSWVWWCRTHGCSVRLHVEEVVQRLGSQLLTRNVHLAPSTQQAKQAGFTCAEITRRASQFSLKINKKTK
jgi:hypothetical protein